MGRPEGIIETRLRVEVEKIGGLCLKFVSPGNRGVPDRWVILPGIVPFLVETKAPGEKPGRLQDWWHRRLRLLGVKVFVIDSIEGIFKMLDEVRTI